MTKRSMLFPGSIQILIERSRLSPNPNELERSNCTTLLWSNLERRRSGAKMCRAEPLNTAHSMLAKLHTFQIDLEDHSWMH